MKISTETIQKTIKESDNTLTSTHEKLCIPIISRMYKKMINGFKFDDIKVCDELIIDGHHRYVSSLLAGVELNVLKSPKTSATHAYDWTDVEFVDEEWYTEDKIKQINELDAEF